MDRPHAGELRKGRWSRPGGIYFLTKCCEPSFVFSNRQRNDVAEALQHYWTGKKALYLIAFVVMPDHWHGLIIFRERLELSQLVKQIGRRASYPTRQLRSRIQWQEDGFHDHLLREDESVVEYVNYVESNPVRSDLTERSDEWPDSSAHTNWSEKLDRDQLDHRRWDDPM